MPLDDSEWSGREVGGDPKKTSRGPWNPREKRLTRKKRSSRTQVNEVEKFH